ncbi:MAG TPA: phage holin family protein [Trebonia sp.]|nr:phage holin family protein [Trebonia sp.]
MEHPAGSVQVPAQGSTDHQQPSTGELVKRLSEQVSVLVRDELKLAQLEMTRKGKQAGIGAGMFGASGLVALYGVGCLLACAILGLSRVLEPWLAALIVGAALLAVSAVAALAGRARLKRSAPLVPAQAADSVKADVNQIRERAHR